MGNKKINWFDIFKWVLSFFITVGLAVLGAFCHKNEGYSKVACIVAVIVLPIALICWIIANFVLKKKFENSIDRKNLQNELVAQRDRAEEIAKEKSEASRGYFLRFKEGSSLQSIKMQNEATNGDVEAATSYPVDEGS